MIKYNIIYANIIMANSNGEGENGNKEINKKKENVRVASIIENIRSEKKLKMKSNT